LFSFPKYKQIDFQIEDYQFGGKHNSQVSQTTNASDGTFFIRCEMSLQWGINGDTSAQQWGTYIFRNRSRDWESPFSWCLNVTSKPTKFWNWYKMVCSYLATELVAFRGLAIFYERINI